MMAPEAWQAPPPRPELADDAIHVWRASLDASQYLPRSLESSLSPDEHARAERFHFPRDRIRFVTGRGLLRHILARYLDIIPERLRFGYGDRGKPFLVEPEKARLRFNLSHDAGMLLVAVARAFEVGVDVEQVPADHTVTEVGDLVLSAPEKDVLDRLHGEARRIAFARLWTRKEAYTKADGGGLFIALTLTDVSGPENHVRVFNEATKDWTDNPRWDLRTLCVGSGYEAALAVESDGGSPVYWQWSESPEPGTSLGLYNKEPWARRAN